MDQVRCPYCNVSLFAPELASGRCENCGKQLPAALQRSAAPAAAPRPVGSPRPRKKVHWGALIGGVFSCLFALFFFSMVLTGEAEKMAPSTSRRSRAFEQLFGKTGTSVLCGLVFAGIGIYAFSKSVRDA